jgi:hypothetical protein
MSDGHRYDIRWAERSAAFSQKSCRSACLPWSSHRPATTVTVKA